jgi:hypothetical protein
MHFGRIQIVHFRPEKHNGKSVRKGGRRKTTEGLISAGEVEWAHLRVV